MAPKLPAPAATGKSLLSASAEGAKFLILLQISSRLLTFIVNQLLLRYLSPALLGISVQLELFTISVLYFSRESLRNAVQRQPPASYDRIVVVADNEKKQNKNDGAQLKEGMLAGDTQTVINLSLLAIPLGVFFSATLGWFYAGSLASVETAEQPYFRASVGLYVLATLLELIGEPGFAIAQQRMMYRLRAGAESAAAGARCVLTCGITVWAARRGVALGPLPFAVGQIGYGLVLLLVYGVQVWRMAEEDGFGVGLRRIEGCFLLQCVVC
jgi:oligosaccharide translocation protein RFT1